MKTKTHTKRKGQRLLPAAPLLGHTFATNTIFKLSQIIVKSLLRGALRANHSGKHIYLCAKLALILCGVSIPYLVNASPPPRPKMPLSLIHCLTKQQHALGEEILVSVLHNIQLGTQTGCNAEKLGAGIRPELEPEKPKTNKPREEGAGDYLKCFTHLLLMVVLFGVTLFGSTLLLELIGAGLNRIAWRLWPNVQAQAQAREMMPRRSRGAANLPRRRKSEGAAPVACSALLCVLMFMGDFAHLSEIPNLLYHKHQ